MRNRQVVLASRPQGQVEETNFRIVETDLPQPRDGQVLARVLYLSLDPYMRGRMDDARSYASPQPVGEVMIGGTIAEVVESKEPGLRKGDVITGMGGWQEFHVADAKAVRKIDVSLAPASAWLGVLGMPGVTAWYGLTQIGSVVGQLAKIAGCRAVGVAGGAAKCEHVVRDLGFDACIDYKAASFKDDFKKATSDRIDVVFENVGGAVFDAALARMNAFGRVALCGLVAGYNGQDISLHNVRSLLVNRLLLQGFIVTEHMEVWPQALRELAGHVAAKRIRYRETVAEGLENAPRAFLGMLRGENLGKQVVKVG